MAQILREAIDALLSEHDALTRKASRENRSLTADENTRARDIEREIGQHRERLLRAENRNAQLGYGDDAMAQNSELRSAALGGNPAPSSFASAQIDVAQRDPGHYARRSWFGDAWARGKGSTDAAQRLEETRRFTVQEMERRALAISADATGGALVPPLHIQSMFQEKVTQAAVTASLANRHDLPDNTDSISVPRQTGAASVDLHTENTAISQTDAAFDSVSCDVVMAAGRQTMSIQAVERSTPGIDAIILGHLGELLAADLDIRVINGTGQVVGILNTTGINAVDYTDADPSVAELYPKYSESQYLVHTGAKAQPSAIVMHPRRWAWHTASVDADGRPLVGVSGGADNALGVTSGMADGKAVGRLQGVPVYVDSHIPTDLGTGTNEDAIIVGDFDQAHLWAGIPLFEVSQDELFSQGSVVVRARQYFAFTAGLRPAGFAAITGDGLVPPTF